MKSKGIIVRKANLPFVLNLGSSSSYAIYSMLIAPYLECGQTFPKD
ncbi:Uncharacterised protein [Yersinia enterocolitica]|nr:Uncharacterised protein [Yersinia enterocolitica]